MEVTNKTIENLKRAETSDLFAQKIRCIKRIESGQQDTYWRRRFALVDAELNNRYNKMYLWSRREESYNLFFKSLEIKK